MSAFSDYAELKILDHMCGVATWTAPTGVYVKLHVGAPGEAGTANAAAETTRKQATFGSAAAAGSISNTVKIEWTNVSTSETYSHISLWDHVSAGNCLMTAALTAPKAVTAGDNASIAIGALVLSVA